MVFFHASACPSDRGSQTITTSNGDQVVPPNMAPITRFVGDSLALICTGTSVSKPPDMTWEADLINQNSPSYHYCDRPETGNVSCTQQPFLPAVCISTAMLNFTYLTLNDTGNYTCYIIFGGDQFAFNATTVSLKVRG